MIRSPASPTNPRGRQSSRTATLPAPVSGWNARDPLASMSPKYALTLENWFPRATDVELRSGAVAWATGFASQPKRFLAWNGQTTSELFAATSTGIYDVTASAAIGASVSTVTSGELFHTNFSIVGGHYLIAVNGVDKLKLYDGTTWADIDGVSVPAITGLVTTSLAYVAVIKRRLWFVGKDSTSAWYLPVASIGGALTEFPLGQLFSLGGYLVSMATWTIDGGDGADDYTLFISSKGQLVVYKGSDPASSTTWSHVGTYYVGEPLGRDCFTKFGGDTLLLTQNGLFPLSKALQNATIDRTQALTSIIDTAFAEAVGAYGDLPGWKAVVYPKGSFLLVNIPVTSSYTIQYVMNLITGAWCKFTGWYATDWIVHDTELFFLNTLRSAQAWTGVSDFGAVITGRCQQAYNSFSPAPREKHFKLLRPTVFTRETIILRYGLDVNYTMSSFDTINTITPASDSLWDSAHWDEVVWAAGEESHRDWGTVASRPGYSASFRLQVATKTTTVKWASTDFVYQVGGVL